MDCMDVAKAAARQAGKVLNRMFGRLDQDAIEFKGEIDLVTKADKEAEKRILSLIREHFPDHGFWAEESGVTGGDSEYTWVIDPLDGTTNFAHGFPWFAVSIGLRKGNETVLGVVYSCCRDELFAAERGGGAYCNDQPIRVSDTKDLKSGLFVTGYPYDLAWVDAYVKQTQSMLKRCRGLRRTGSAALNLCYVASGTFSGFWEFNLNPWDIAAGALIVEEAGGKVTDFTGKGLDLNVGNIVASNGLMHEQLLVALQP